MVVEFVVLILTLTLFIKHMSEKIKPKVLNNKEVAQVPHIKQTQVINTIRPCRILYMYNLLLK